ncbi:MAG: diguanylate cyclase [Chloroflexota bacterium]|nr:diguanylate cyclase [Chloroflexota bacterium]
MKILIADDSAVPRLILEKTLTSLGHETLSASDGSEAWAAFQAFQPDVILSDWLMPGMDGIELCRRIRGLDGDRYTYFVLLTAMTELEHAVTAMTAGADDFMVKPLDRFRLEATLIAARRVTALHDELSDQRAGLVRLNSLLYDDARRDPLTLLGNRLRLGEDLVAAAGRIARYGHTYCLALYDIDFFKAYNDTFGHPAGDEALRRVAQALVGSIRTGDMAYRYGGEEFLVLLPEQTLTTAALAVERTRAAVQAIGLSQPTNQPSATITLSAGIAESCPADSLDVDGWLRRADIALYQAKGRGRNQVVAFEAVAAVA